MSYPGREEARALARSALAVAQREAHRRQARPRYWWEFHYYRFFSLPRWRWAARIYHRNQANRYAAFAKAEGDHACRELP